MATAKKAGTSVARSNRGHVVVHSPDVVLERFAVAEDLVDAVRNAQKVVVAEEDFDEAQFLERRLNATSIEDLFPDSSKLETPSNHLNEIITLTGYQGLRPSTVNRLGVYGIVDCVNRDGEAFAMAIGNTDSLVAVMKLHEMEGYPIRVRFVEAGKARQGENAPINIVKVKDGEDF